jgi:hypothetical protein
MSVPTKPFTSYKWRWLSVAPSEGLLKAPVFLGVLRALKKFEGKAYSSLDLHRELNRVQRDTKTNIDLARTPDRNLFRNSGQYWRGTGLVAPVSGEIKLTNLGRRIASGQITNDDFAALMVRNTVLPNPATYSNAEMAKWKDAGLRIKPFELILSVMDKLGRSYGITEAFLSPTELIRVVIPLAGAKASVDRTVKSVFGFRKGHLDVSSWPDCVPAANDKRLAREFLLFLQNFGICQIDETTERYEQKFYLDQVMNAEVQLDAQPSFFEKMDRIDEEVATLRDSEIPLIIERTRVMASVLRRTNQSKFRREVLEAGDNRCVLTQECTLEVLEAAHIVPVGQGGSDLVGNGLCMRVDIHRLYDSGKIRIEPNGVVTLNEQIENAVSYAGLPTNIIFPQEINAENLEWRSRYL